MMWWERTCKKSNDSHLPDHAKCVQEKGTITFGAIMLVLVAILAITAIPNVPVIIPSNLKDLIIAILAAQVVSQSFAGRHENQ